MKATKTKSAHVPTVLGLFRSVKNIDDVPKAAPTVSVDPAAISALVEEASALSTANDQFEQTAATARSNAALYELLGKLYDYGLRVAELPNHLRDEVVKAFRAAIKDRTKKTVDPAVPLMTLIVKFVVKVDNRQTTLNYSRALRVAQSYAVPVGGFPAYVEGREGLQNLVLTKEEEDRRKVQKQKADLIRESIRHELAQAKPIEWSNAAAWVGTGDEETADKGEFTVILARRDKSSVRLGAAFKLPLTAEDALINTFAAVLKDNEVSGVQADPVDATAGNSN
jgi:hypothetical protein